MNGASSADITAHSNWVKQHIREGKEVLLITHSLGSYYANKIYEGLNSMDQSAVGLVFIGPWVGSM